MKTVADVKCYHCGHISGEAILAPGSQSVITAFRPAAGSSVTTSPVTGGLLRCSRCNGPVYLDEPRVVYPRHALTSAELKPRRGRPSKADVLARQARLAALGYAS